MSEEKALTLPERASVALGAPKYEQEIRELVAKTVTITEVKNKDGRDQCHGAMMTLKNTRVAIEKAAKGAREDATAFSKAVIAEEKRLVALTEPEEARLQGLRDAWDAEIEREKAAKAAAEKQRVDGIRKRIDEMKAIPAAMIGKPSEHIACCIEGLDAASIELSDFAEFSGEAEMAKIAALEKLREMHAAQRAHEAEQARLAEERAELERLRREAAERDRQIAEARALDERLAREAREREAARVKAEQDKAAAELREERERIEADQRAAKEKADAAFAAERKAAALTQAAMSEIQGIQQQVMIAVTGRSGVRKGGTIACIRETLAETEAWEIDPERFGVLAGAAEMAKTTAVAEIRRMLADAERLEQEAAEERARREAAEAAERAEAERIAEAQAAEEARLKAEKDAAEREQIRRVRMEFAKNGPGDVEIVETLAKHYDVEIGDVMQWIKKFDYAAADEYFAAANVAAN
ncbi:hypothetical protein AB4Y32_16230 [Paraburkholderia phymatum]|uniref:Uncharacterized protein n=1 Tax=Paraburkholderia phymatum TaxID=148447 RepID=A0ACC6U0U3_9BURK